VVKELGKELELREARLKFRGSWEGDSEVVVIMEGGVENVVLCGSMMSVSAEKDELLAGGSLNSPF
jgi:hypothetical protein